MARGDDNKRVEELERRAATHERELIVLAETIKELVDQIQQLAQSQVQIIESHDELLHKITELDRALNGAAGEGQA